MSKKKPAKPIAGQSKLPVLDPAVYGVTLKFFGSKNSACACNKCGKLTVRGMVRIKNDNYYCSMRCASNS